MSSLISISIIFFIPLALVVAFIVFGVKALHSLRDYRNANHKKISLPSIALTALLAITLIILGERLLYDINRWFNPAYGELPVDFSDIRDYLRRAINIGLGSGGIVSAAGFVICGLAWIINYFHKRQTHALIKILFTLSILAILLFGVLWTVVSYTLNVSHIID